MSVILRRIDIKIFYPVTYILNEYHVSGDLIDIDEMKFIITDESNSVIYLERKTNGETGFTPESGLEFSHWSESLNSNRMNRLMYRDSEDFLGERKKVVAP